MTKEPRLDPMQRVVSHSTLGWLAKSPAYFKFRVEHPEFDVKTPAFVFGGMFHTMVLEPDKFDDRYFILNEDQRPEPEKNMSSKINKEWKAEIFTANEGKEVVKSSDKKNAENMAESVMKRAGDFFPADAIREKELRWRKEGTDLKGFIDIDYQDLFMVDLKSAVDATPFKWQRKAFWDFNSHRQAAMYLDGDAKGLYTGEKEFYFVVVEKVPPYLVSIHLVSKNKFAEGMVQYQMLLRLLKKCRETDSWPHFDPVISVWE